MAPCSSRRLADPEPSINAAGGSRVGKIEAGGAALQQERSGHGGSFGDVGPRGAGEKNDPGATEGECLQGAAWRVGAIQQIGLSGGARVNEGTPPGRAGENSRRGAGKQRDRVARCERETSVFDGVNRDRRRLAQTRHALTGWWGGRRHA